MSNNKNNMSNGKYNFIINNLPHVDYVRTKKNYFYKIVYGWNGAIEQKKELKLIFSVVISNKKRGRL